MRRSGGNSVGTILGMWRF